MEEVFNPKFIETLKKKLTHGNARSILLNALPGRRATRLPLTDLDVINNGLSSLFLEKLTSEEKFEVNFSISFASADEDRQKLLSKINKRLHAIKYEHDDNVKEIGVETFGFGYPLIIKRKKNDVKKFLVAPLFIWKLDISETYKKGGEWSIKRIPDHDIKVNEIFASYLESEESIKIESLPDEMLEDCVLDKDEILEYINSVSRQLNISEEVSLDWVEFDKLPDRIDPEKNDKDVYVLESGVFGIFKSQKQSLIKETENLLKDYNNIFAAEVDSVVWNNSHSPVNTDPSQNGVLRSLNENTNIVIQGPPGTGKSQTLTAIIASALANNKKVLVVCEKRTALEVIEKNLLELIPELQNSIALIEDVVRDRRPVVDLARAKNAGLGTEKTSLSESVEIDVKKFEKIATDLNTKYQSLRSAILRDERWVDLVGKWLVVEGEERYDNILRLLAPLLKGHTDELGLNNCITIGSDYYAKIKKNSATLEEVFNGFDSKAMPSREILYILQESKDTIDSLIVEFQSHTVKYSETTAEYISSIISSTIAELRNIDSILKEANRNNINPKKITLGNKVKAVFSGNYKRVLKNVKLIDSKLNRINRIYAQEFGDTVSIDDVTSKIKHISSSVNELKQKVVESDGQLPAGSIRNHKGFNVETWNSLLEGVEKVLSKLSQVVYINRHPIDDVPVKDVISFLQNYIQQIEKAQSVSEHIDDYFNWKQYLIDSQNIEKKVFDVLLNVETGEWLTRVNDAFLYNRLSTEDVSNRFPTDDATLGILSKLGHDIGNYQKSIIKNNLEYWDTLAINKYKDSNYKVNQLYNLRGSKGQKRRTLRNIIQTDFESFSNFFPVLLMNPITVSTLLPLERGLVDTVIFDEASQLRIEDTFSSLIRGRQVIVSGDSQQMPPSNYFAGDSHLIDDDGNETDEDDLELVGVNAVEMASEESLLSFAIQCGFQQTYLDMHYRSRHPDLIEFSNVCFYNSRLLPMPEKSGYSDTETPISYKHVNGFNINGTNPDECTEVIRLLKEEVSNEQSVGVATFNIQQRNYILNAIGLERENDTSFNFKMAVLDDNGFFVKNLENIQGDERDVIILSTTFGNKPDRKFTLQLGPITGANGYRLLNVIITRAKHKLFAVTSIPEFQIRKYKDRIASTGKVDGTSALLGYLDYAKCVSENDTAGKEAILGFITKELGDNEEGRSANTSTGFSESPFEEEVYNWLVGEVGQERIVQQYKCGGFRLDMVVKSKSDESRMLAIECDGAAYHSSELNWHHDIYRQNILEKEHGFVFHRIWSTKWWRNAKGEFKKLMDAIDEFESQQ